MLFKKVVNRVAKEELEKCVAILQKAQTQLKELESGNHGDHPATQKILQNIIAAQKKNIEEVKDLIRKHEETIKKTS
jgi:ATP/maltotriose-dependent transcriptional regulator MalT